VSAVEAAIAAIRAGRPILLPTDTVYGLCADAYREQPVLRLSQLKGRSETQPIALLAGDLDVVLDAVPELLGRAAVRARALLPGPYTLVLPNPARRFRWLAGSRPDTIGIRVPELPAEASTVLDRIGALAATSANRHGESDPAQIGNVPDEIRLRVDAIVDVGPLPGTASTVLDLTGPEPVVLREGAGSVEQALARVRDVG
jgi:L-threonylcarbamoyladenylate synthase